MRFKAAVLGTLVLSFSAQASEHCMRAAEVKADQVRFVETQMRIAALQCRGGGHRDMIGLYNDFVRSKRPYFVEAEKPLRTFLNRAEKGNLESYVTATANRVSLNSGSVEQFCDRSRMALAMAFKMPDPAGLISLMPVQYRQPERNCATQSARSNSR